MSDIRDSEKEIRKKAIFDSMSPRRQRQIMKKGFDSWDPFIEPKDPIDIRRDKTNRTSIALVRDFLHSRDLEEYSNEYGRGVFDICFGLINDQDRYLAMYEFSVWYHSLLKEEGYEE
jgi:hypothetical protein